VVDIANVQQNRRLAQATADAAALAAAQDMPDYDAAAIADVFLRQVLLDQLGDNPVIDV
jgi:uncharacterized membrane protein